MKAKYYFPFLCLLLCVATPSVFGQTCNDYPCVIRKVKKAMESKNYKYAFEQLESAGGYPSKNDAEITKLRKTLFGAVEKEKMEAQKQKLIAEENARKAQLNYEVAEKEKQITIRNARAIENSAVYMNLVSSYPNLALAMMKYDYIHYPENRFVRERYHTILGEQPEPKLLRTIGGFMVRSVSFSPDGTKVLTSGFNQAAVIWDIESGTPEKKFVVDDYDFQAAYSPNGNQIATNRSNGLQLWDIKSEKVVKYFVGHSTGITNR